MYICTVALRPCLCVYLCLHSWLYLCVLVCTFQVISTPNRWCSVIAKVDSDNIWKFKTHRKMETKVFNNHKIKGIRIRKKKKGPIIKIYKIDMYQPQVCVCEKSCTLKRFASFGNRSLARCNHKNKISRPRELHKDFEMRLEDKYLELIHTLVFSKRRGLIGAGRYKDET